MLQVTVGNLRLQLGYLRYEVDETLKQIYMIAGIVAAVVLALAVICESDSWLPYKKTLPLAHQAQSKCHMQTAWIQMRRRVTQRLIWIQAV